MFVIIVALVLVVFGAVEVHSDCHNDEPCEDVHNDVISKKRWDTNHNNVVRYYVNNNFLPILPSLFPDVTESADEWSEIWYEPEREEVNFSLDYRGETHLSPTGNSQHNIVGWGRAIAYKKLLDGSVNLGHCICLFDARGHRIRSIVGQIIQNKGLTTL